MLVWAVRTGGGNGAGAVIQTAPQVCPKYLKSAPNSGELHCLQNARTLSRAIIANMLLPKYSAAEIERRWIANLSQVGELATIPTREIEDRYILGTRIRLRKVSTGAGAPVIFKLGKKYGKNSYSEQVVSVYLTEAEFEAMSRMPGTVARKSRYTVAGGALDVYQYPNTGLAVFEVEFPTESAAVGYIPPEFISREITHDSTYSGFALSQAIADSPTAAFGRGE